MSKATEFTQLGEAELEDQFSGGGHTRTADQLRRTIEEFSNQDKNRAIGLYGDWGSGKTTVVGLAEKALSETYAEGKGLKYRFFTFDLWSANTAHFKRTLLEDLIDWAESQRSDIRTDLSSERDKVRDREVTTTSDLNLKFSRLGIFFFLLIPLIPIVYSWLSPEAFNNPKTIFEIEWLSKNFGEWAGKVTGWKLAIGLLLILLASAAASVVMKKFVEGESFRDAFSHVLSLVSQKEKTNTITQNIREKDPNEHEFDHHFRKILSLIQSDGSKVVLVFDNIDRLGDGDLVEYWALVRSVFSSSNMRAIKKNQSCIVIVPYVAKAIESSFTNGHGGGDLFAKTFDVVQRVAQPVLSDVSQFLSLKIEERFVGKLNPEEKSALIEIFEFSVRQQTRAAVTPRSIKTYVNEVADLHATWVGEVPIACLAIYVCNRKSIEDNPSSTQFENEEVARYFRFDASGETTKYLAALAFNVEPELAYQTLLAPEITTALSRGDRDKLKELEGVKGFSQVFREVLQKDASTIASDGLAALAALAHCAARISSDQYQRTQFANDTLAAISNLPSQGAWELKNLDNFDPILSMLEGVDRSEVVPKIAGLLGGPVGEKPSYDEGRSWSYAVARMTEKLGTAGFGKPEELAGFFDSGRGANFALGAASTSNVARISHKNLKKTFSARDLKESFLAILETHTGQAANIVIGLSEAGKYSAELAKSSLGVLKNGLVTEIVDNADRYETWTRAFADVYRESSTIAHKGSQQELHELIDHGGFIWHIHKFCSGGENNSLLALALELSLARLTSQKFAQKPNAGVQVFSNFHQSSHWFSQLLNGASEVNAETYSALAQRCAHEYLSDIMNVAQSDLTHAKIAQSALQVIASPDIKRRPQFVSNILSDESWLRKNNPELLSRMLEDTKDLIDEDDIKGIDLNTTTVSLLKDALAVGSDGWKKYDRSVAAKFEELDEAAWSSLLHQGGNAYELLLAKLGGLGAKPKINSAGLRNPLEGYFLAVLSGDSKTPTQLGDSAFELVSDAMRKSVVKSIAGKFAQSNFTVDSIVRTNDLFPDTMNQVISHPMFASGADTVVTSLVSTKDDRVLDFLNQHSQEVASHISKYNSDGVVALKESFVGWYEDHQFSETIANIAKNLGLEIEFPASADEPNSEETESE